MRTLNNFVALLRYEALKLRPTLDFLYEAFGVVCFTVIVIGAVAGLVMGLLGYISPEEQFRYAVPYESHSDGHRR